MDLRRMDVPGQGNRALSQLLCFDYVSHGELSRLFTTSTHGFCYHAGSQCRFCTLVDNECGQVHSRVSHILGWPTETTQATGSRKHHHSCMDRVSLSVRACHAIQCHCGNTSVLQLQVKQGASFWKLKTIHHRSTHFIKILSKAKK